MGKYDVDPLREFTPYLMTREILVGHDYLVNEPIRGDQENITDMAVDLAYQLARNNSDDIPDHAGLGVVYTNAGYRVTFAWVEWALETSLKEDKDGNDV